MLGNENGQQGINVNLANKFVAGAAGLAILILIGVWLAFFQQDVPSVNKYFPDGACDGASACVNALGGFGTRQYDRFSLVRWFFVFVTLNILSLIGAGLVGGKDKLGNGIAIVTGVVGGMINIALIAFMLIAWIPNFNRAGAGYRDNPFNDDRYCCVPAFFADPANFCPNGQPNYPAGMEVPCVAPLTTLADTQLTINGRMVYLLIALIAIILADAAYALAAYFSIQDPSKIFGVLGQFISDMMGGEDSRKRYNIMKIKGSDNDDDSDYEEYNRTGGKYVNSYAGQ